MPRGLHNSSPVFESTSESFTTPVLCFNPDQRASQLQSCVSIQIRELHNSSPVFESRSESFTTSVLCLNPHQRASQLQSCVSIQIRELHNSSPVFESRSESFTTSVLFLQISVSVWMRYSMLLWPVGLMKFIVGIFHNISVQGKELY